MAFTKGTSGNPGGRPKYKPWKEAIEMALKRGDNTIHRIADKIVQMAVDGDIQAMREIAERIEGKVPQNTTIETSIDPVDDPHDIAIARLKQIANQLGLMLIAKDE